MDFCLIVSVGTWQKGQFAIVEQKRSSRWHEYKLFTGIGNRCYHKHYNVQDEKSMAKRKRLYLRSGMRQNAAGKRYVRHSGGS